MKKCPFCAEEIQDEAIKCKHCGEFLEKRPSIFQGKWYEKSSLLVLAFLMVGPLALPLVWINSQYTNTKKLVITVVVIVLSWWLWGLFQQSLDTMNQYNQMLGL